MAIHHPDCKAHSHDRSTKFGIFVCRNYPTASQSSLRKALGTGSLNSSGQVIMFAFESTRFTRQTEHDHLARTVTSGPVTRLQSYYRDGDPPSGLQGSGLTDPMWGGVPPSSIKSAPITGLAHSGDHVAYAKPGYVHTDPGEVCFADASYNHIPLRGFAHQRRCAKTARISETPA